MTKLDTQQAVADAVAAKANAVALTGSGAAVWFGLTANEIAAFGGLAVAVAGLLVNVWFRWQSLQIERKKAGIA